ncbi:hypothetical protein CG719_21950 [Streptomyces sp. CB01373]|nr:hypothetical protein CG719_21950 [Streptomyces sp. CB01373]
MRIAIMVIGCLIGYFVFKHSTHARPGLPATRGDIVEAISVACAVITVLMLLFGDVGKGQHNDSSAPVVNPTSVFTAPSSSAMRN